MITVNHSDGFEVEEFPLNTSFAGLQPDTIPLFKLRAEVLLVCRPPGYRVAGQRHLNFPSSIIYNVLKEDGKEHAMLQTERSISVCQRGQEGHDTRPGCMGL